MFKLKQKLIFPSKTIPFTPKKYAEMEALVIKIEKELIEVKKRLTIAREMGDLSENGAYKYAKFEIRDLKRKLRRNQYLLLFGYPSEKAAQSDGSIHFGSSVKLQDLDDPEKQLSFMVVSNHESDPAENKLSFKSPMGKAVMNKKVGDEVKVVSPRREKVFLVIGVE